MNELEVDAILARLVPEYESVRLQATLARAELLLVSVGHHVDRKAAIDARERWQELEDNCATILQRIEQLADLSEA
jgi:hypothetical protein